MTPRWWRSAPVWSRTLSTMIRVLSRRYPVAQTTASISTLLPSANPARRRWVLVRRGRTAMPARRRSRWDSPVTVPSPRRSEQLHFAVGQDVRPEQRREPAMVFHREDVLPVRVGEQVLDHERV